MEDSQFEDLRQWLQSQIMFQDSWTEVMSGSTCRSSAGPSQLRPTSPKKIALTENNSEDSAAHAFSTANAGPSSKKIQTLTDEQKEILNYKEKEKRTGFQRQDKRVAERWTDPEGEHPTEGRDRRVVRQSNNKRPSNTKQKNLLELQVLETEETTKIEHLVAWQSEEEREVHWLNETTKRNHLGETEKPMLDKPDQSRPPERMKINQFKNQGKSGQQQKEMEQIEGLERDEKDMERMRKEEKDEMQREKECPEELLIWRMRQREKEHHNEMKKQKRRLGQTQGSEESKADMKTIGETESQSETLNQCNTQREKAMWLEDHQEATERQLRGREREFKREVRRLLREKERELDEETEVKRNKETGKQNLSGESETDSQCQEGDESQTLSQHEEDSSLDTQENDIFSLTDDEEGSECSKIYDEDEDHSKNDPQLHGRDRSVRRRVIRWINDKMKAHYQKKIRRTIQREHQEGDDIYVSGVLGGMSKLLGLGRIYTRAEREQEKRAQLLKADARRQLMESMWLQWERDRKKKKEERKAREKEERNRTQLAWILQQNTKADRNLDRHSGREKYASTNKLLKKQMIGWERSSEQDTPRPFSRKNSLG